MNPRIFGEILPPHSRQRELLCERLVQAHTDFLSIHNRLVAGQDLDVRETLQRCLDHLDAIADICRLTDLHGLRQICTELRHYIKSSIYGFDAYQIIVRKLVVWADDILVYIDNQDELSIIQKLFEPLPQSNKMFLKTVMGLHMDQDVTQTQSGANDTAEHGAAVKSAELENTAPIGEAPEPTDEDLLIPIESDTGTAVYESRGRYYDNPDDLQQSGYAAAYAAGGAAQLPLASDEVLEYQIEPDESGAHPYSLQGGTEGNGDLLSLVVAETHKEKYKDEEFNEHEHAARNTDSDDLTSDSDANHATPDSTDDLAQMLSSALDEQQPDANDASAERNTTDEDENDFLVMGDDGFVEEIVDEPSALQQVAHPPQSDIADESELESNSATTEHEIETYPDHDIMTSTDTESEMNKDSVDPMAMLNEKLDALIDGDMGNLPLDQNDLVDTDTIDNSVSSVEDESSITDTEDNDPMADSMPADDSDIAAMMYAKDEFTATDDMDPMADINQKLDAFIVSDSADHTPDDINVSNAEDTPDGTDRLGELPDSETHIEDDNVAISSEYDTSDLADMTDGDDYPDYASANPMDSGSSGEIGDPSEMDMDNGISVHTDASTLSGTSEGYADAFADNERASDDELSAMDDDSDDPFMDSDISEQQDLAEADELVAMSATNSDIHDTANYATNNDADTNDIDNYNVDENDIDNGDLDSNAVVGFDVDSNDFDSDGMDSDTVDSDVVDSDVVDSDPIDNDVVNNDFIDDDFIDSDITASDIEEENDNAVAAVEINTSSIAHDSPQQSDIENDSDFLVEGGNNSIAAQAKRLEQNADFPTSDAEGGDPFAEYDTNHGDAPIAMTTDENDYNVIVEDNSSISAQARKLEQETGTSAAEDTLDIDSVLVADDAAPPSAGFADDGVLLDEDDDDDFALQHDDGEPFGAMSENDDDGILLGNDDDDGVLLGDDDDDDGILLGDDSDEDLIFSDQNDFIDDNAVFEDTAPEQTSAADFAVTDLDDFDSDDSFDFSDDGLFAADDEPQPEDLLGVLQQELSQITPAIIQLGTTISSTEDEQELVQSVQAYTELLQRIMVAAEALGLQGLHDIGQFVTHNISSAASMDLPARAKMARLIDAWPSFVAAYLLDPKDDSGCVCLVDHLQEDAWPHPISGEEARDLYVSLAEGMKEWEELDDQEARQTVASADDVSLTISPDINQELLEAFFIEAPGQAEKFSDYIAQIADGENLLENVKLSQRLAHTLKGSGNLIGAKGVANLTHHIEDILEYLANHHMAPPEPLCELLQESADCLEAMIEAVQGIGPAPDNSLQILQRILDWANRIDQGNIRADDVDSIETPRMDAGAGADASPDESNAPPAANETATEKQATIAANVEMLRVPVDVVDELLRILGEVSIAIGQVQEHNHRLLQQGKNLKLQDSVVQQQRFELENLVDVRSMSTGHRKTNRGNRADAAFDSLEMDQYDELYGTAHRFIESVSDSREISQLIQSELSTLESLFLQQQRLNKELQQIVMTTRMVSVDSITSRLQRAVRQASKVTQKKVNLQIEGGELLIDSNVLNKLVDPLMHMLRNAVDHGIESQEEREAAGKPPAGLVKLTFQHSGNNVRIFCEDDGRGLDYARINEKAATKGLIGENDILSNNELARLILHPGFSTRDSATQISGRGVGMDVVHGAILDLKGTLDIQESEFGGTLFVLNMPISLVTNHSLVVKVDDEMFAIPTNSLEQILASDVGKVNYFGDSSTYHLGDNVYTARSLRSLIGSGDTEISNRDIMLIAKVDNGNVAVSVDQLVNSYDLVTKTTGNYVKGIRGISGVSVLGDGSVVPVLDLPELLRAGAGIRSRRSSTNTDSADSVKHAVTNVLIVDDSLSVRKSLSQFVEDIGYHALQARDGIEATDILRMQDVDIALVDMEMPRMNGIELTTHIRSNEKTKDLPIIMITSRTQQKHRQKAQAAGVSHYLAKPYSEDSLISSMESLLPKAG